MAYTDQNLVITPNNGNANAVPQILFSAANNTVNAQNILLSAFPTSNGTLSFSGSSGQLFSITNQLTGTIFSVNDISGIPSLAVQDTGQVQIAPFNGYVSIGTNTSVISSNSNTTGALQVAGGVGITGNVYANSVYTTTGTGTIYTDNLRYAANGNPWVISGGGGGGGGSGNVSNAGWTSNSAIFANAAGYLISQPALQYYLANNTLSTTGNTTLGGTTLINQTYNQGTGVLQVKGNTAIAGNEIAQSIYVAGNNNLITYSQDFSQTGAWANALSNLAFSFANTTAPDGTLTGTFIYNDATNTNHYTARNITPALVNGTTYTWSVYAKANQLNILYLQSSSGSATFPKTYFNLSTGTVTQTGTGHIPSITSVGNGWYRCAITFVADGGNNPSLTVIGIAATSGTSSYLGDGVSGLYVWGAQMEQAAIASPYTPTTSTIITSNNNLYVANSIAIGTASPNSAIHIVQQGGTGLGSFPTITLDSGTFTSGSLAVAAINMRVNNGAFGQAMSQILYDWYGGYITGSTPSHGINYISGRSGLANHIFRNSSNTTQAIITDYSQAGISFPQKATGTILTSQYIAGLNWPAGGFANLQVTGNTIANGVSTLQNIVVQGNNNLLTYSQDYTNASWTKQNVIVSITNSASEDGNNTAQVANANVAGAYCAISKLVTPSSNVINGYWTFSVYSGTGPTNPGSPLILNFGSAYANGAFSTNTSWSFTESGNQPTVAFVNQTGTVSNTAVGIGSEGPLYRFSVTALLYDPQATQLRCDIVIPSTAGANTVTLWGSQLEQGQQATMYVPTSGTAVTTNNNIYVPTGNVQATNSLVTNKMNWVNSNNASVMYQFYNAATQSYDLVFG